MNLLKNWDNRLLVGMFLFVMISCKEKRPDLIIPEDSVPTITQKQSIEMSQFWTKDEGFKIDQFVKRKKWPVTKSQTGIRYWIYQNGEGELAKPGDVAFVEFEIRLLDADTTLCYTSKETGIQDFLIEMDVVESGLHEAICYMRPGDKAFVILPHYLAHGLLGDMEAIPPLSPVLYDLHLVKLK